MDGLLIDSENIYTEVINEIAAEHGLEPMSWDIRVNLQGRPGPDAAREFLRWFFREQDKLQQTSASPLSLDDLTTSFTTRYEYLRSPELFFGETTRRQQTRWPGRTQFLPGALPLITQLQRARVPIALATSTARANFKLKTGHLRATTNNAVGHAAPSQDSPTQDIPSSGEAAADDEWGFDVFGPHVVTGDDSRIPRGRGKPCPDIWLVALASLNAARATAITPAECLVFEDGLIGVHAARAAGMSVVWVPGAEVRHTLGEARVAAELACDDENSALTGEALRSLEEFAPQKYGLL